ncbi:methyl-accepting chemotaxis protein [Halomonas sabkhae]|uniref:methyl-accepting chemotaxis protein n=1 Tax=Halomonas sabkhae TaxID=626223 RepID=UPI0025B4556D|nr:methyl-accepting chemotaxis protein [Halomonas sabkhae]MDN3524875.1 methyl-accepting chemotaxis protein [Halomonas sabkhae]
MRFIEQMSIRLSGLLVLIAFTVILVTLGALGLYANQHGRTAFDTLREQNVEQSRALHQAYIATLRTQVAMDRAAHLLRTPSFDRPGPVLERAEQRMQEAEAAFERFLAVPAADQAIVDTLASRFQSLLGTGLSLQLMLLQEGDVGAYDSGQSRVSDMSQAFMQEADGFFANAETQGDAQAARFVELSGWLNLALGGALVAALLIVAVVVWGVRRNVLRPLGDVIAHFRRIAEGDLTGEVAARGDNEIDRLFRELDGMRRALAGTVRQVRESADRVFDGASHLSESNQELAARTRQQGGSLERTAANLDEMTVSVADNTEHVREASQLAERASDKASRGGEVVKAFVDTMGEVHERSGRIGEIVGLIDDIAFQTNLLALNASVEAARAGEHGRGFAVVAGEVRNLASRSGRAARDIRELIAASAASVEQGKSLSRQAGDDMRDIVAAIQGVDERIEQVAQASEEQHRGLVALNRDMNQMETVTQRNHGLVERANETAEALEVQAGHMRDFTGRFMLAAADIAPRALEEDSVTPAAETSSDVAREEESEDAALQPA